MFQQLQIVSVKLVTGKNICPPSSKGLCSRFKKVTIFSFVTWWNQKCSEQRTEQRHFKLLCSLSDSEVCTVQRNALTLTLNHKLYPKLYSLASRCPSLLFIMRALHLGKDAPWSRCSLSRIRYKEGCCALKRIYLGLVDHCMQTYW